MEEQKNTQIVAPVLDPKERLILDAVPGSFAIKSTICNHAGVTIRTLYNYLDPSYSKYNPYFVGLYKEAIKQEKEKRADMLRAKGWHRALGPMNSDALLWKMMQRFCPEFAPDKELKDVPNPKEDALKFLAKLKELKNVSNTGNQQGGQKGNNPK